MMKLINKLFKKTEYLYDKKIDASGLAIFRIVYGLVFLSELIQIFYFRHLIFDKIPYLIPSEVDFTYGLIAWMITVVFLIWGFSTKTAAIVNYLFSVVFIATISSYEYHMFYAYMGLNFLFIFIPVSKVISIDRLILKLKYSNTRVNYEPERTTTVLSYFTIVLIGIGFVYFDSVFYKTASYNWLNGLGMWLPASLPQVTKFDNFFFLNQKWLALGLGYLTFIFEAIFLLVFFRKKWRILVLTIGIGLHIGILIEFPLPWFGLGAAGIYLLLVPVAFWKKIKEKLSSKDKSLIFYYDEECPLCNRTKIILGYFDYFEKIEFKGVQTYGFKDSRLDHIDREELLNNIYSITKKDKVLEGINTYKYALLRIPLLFPIGLLLQLPGIYHLAKWIYKKVAQNRYVERCTEDNCGYTPRNFPAEIDDIKITNNFTFKKIRLIAISFLIFLFIVLQLNVTYNSLAINKLKSSVSMQSSTLDKAIQKVSIPLMKMSKTFFGICQHAVFMDSHFNDYNHIIAIRAVLKNGKEVWLPIVDKDGQPDYYIYSFNWVKWTFRVNAPHIKQKQLKEGIRDFVTFWAFKNSVKLNEVSFDILCKKVIIPKKWEKNFLQKQIQNEWSEIGTAFWNNSEFIIDIPIVEDI